MTTSQPFSSFAAQFDQADEPVGGKWGDRFNQFRSGVETLHKGLQLLNKINNERKKAGFDVDSSAAEDSSFDFGSAQSGTDHPTFEFTHNALNVGQETDAGDEAVGGMVKVAWKVAKNLPIIIEGVQHAHQIGKQLGLWDEQSESADRLETDTSGAFESGYNAREIYQAGKQIYNWGKQANLWDEQSESADRLETDASGAFDRTAIDPLTGSQMSTTSAFYQDAMDVGNESVGVKATDFVSWWNVDSSDMAAAEGNQFDGTFKTLSASDLPTAPDADSMADLLPVATDPLA